MKILKAVTALVLTLVFTAGYAQNEIPQGYTKASIVLANGTILSGHLKENIRRDAAISFIDEANSKKKEYDGSDLVSVQFNEGKYLCIKGDFFKVVTEGELSFLQKSSDASGKSVYNGQEAVFINGTEGKPGDYFIYGAEKNELKKISKKNITELTAGLFSGCAAAIEKASTVNGDIALVKDAVEIFNNRNNK